MRCPDCNKFVSLETGEPEEQSLEINHEDGDTYRITGEFRVPRNCAECSQELKEGVFQFDFTTEVKDVKEEERKELAVEVESMEVNESGGGRYAKNVFSISAEFRVATTERELATGIAGDSDELSAGSFEELV